jgi:hypothetical protein
VTVSKRTQALKQKHPWAQGGTNPWQSFSVSSRRKKAILATAKRAAGRLNIEIIINIKIIVYILAKVP